MHAAAKCRINPHRNGELGQSNENKNLFSASLNVALLQSGVVRQLAPLFYDDPGPVMFLVSFGAEPASTIPAPSLRPVVRGQLSDSFGSAATMLNELADDRVPQWL